MPKDLVDGYSGNGLVPLRIPMSWGITVQQLVNKRPSNIVSSFYITLQDCNTDKNNYEFHTIDIFQSQRAQRVIYVLNP